MRNISNEDANSIIFCHVGFFLYIYISYLNVLPSLIGVLGLSPSELLQSVGSTADGVDSFVTTQSSKTSKDYPMGFANFASVSVVYLL